MKTSLIAIILTLLTVTTTTAEPPPASKMVGLAIVGKVDSNLVERVSSWTEVQSGLKVKTLDGGKPARSAEAQEKALVGLLSKDVGLVVALCAKVPKNTKPMLLNKEARVGMVDLTVLNEENPDAEMFGRRAERAFLRNMAFIFGLEASPDPHCVTSRFQGIKWFDQMGRNFSPPSLMNLQRQAFAEGYLRSDKPGMIMVAHPGQDPPAEKAAP